MSIYHCNMSNLKNNPKVSSKTSISDVFIRVLTLSFQTILCQSCWFIFFCIFFFLTWYSPPPPSPASRWLSSRSECRLHWSWSCRAEHEETLATVNFSFTLPCICHCCTCLTSSSPCPCLSNILHESKSSWQTQENTVIVISCLQSTAVASTGTARSERNNIQ